MSLQSQNKSTEQTRDYSDWDDIQFPPGAIPYEPRRLQRQRYTGGDALLNTPTSRVADAFKAIVDVEGPISIDVAKNRVVDAWGTRKGSRIDSYLDRAINYAYYNSKIRIAGNFLWPIEKRVPHLRIHLPGSPVRPITDISPEEIMLALFECVKGAVGITADDLIRETCKLFGLKATQENAHHIERHINHMVTEKVFRNDVGKISIVKKNSNST